MITTEWISRSIGTEPNQNHFLISNVIQQTVPKLIATLFQNGNNTNHFEDGTFGSFISLSEHYILKLRIKKSSQMLFDCWRLSCLVAISGLTFKCDNILSQLVKTKQWCLHERDESIACSNRFCSNVTLEWTACTEKRCESSPLSHHVYRVPFELSHRIASISDR